MEIPSVAPAPPAPGAVPGGIDYSRVGTPEALRTSVRHARSFVDEPDALQALRIWINGRTFPSTEAAVAALEQDLAALDELIAAQVNELLHHETFQQFEARWRGLQFLVEQVRSTDDEAPQAMVKIFDVEWRELAKDVQFANEFTQSQLFRRVYDEEFGAPGGQPFGLLLGDFEVGARASGAGGTDLAALRALADTAAAAFAPFVAQAHASLLGLDHLRDLQRQLDLRLRFDSPEMIRWKELRAAPEARFLGLTVPRVLARLPYVDDGSLDHGFRFHEDVAAPDGSGYCWAAGIWALGGVAVRAFQECGWFADMRGVRWGQRGGGLVDDLPAADYGTDAPGVAVRAPLEVAITDETERELAEHGFICLCPNGDGGPDAAFYTMPSLSRPAVYDSPDASANAAISAMLPYLLCVSRFAHALKVIARDRIGGTDDAATLHARLAEWIRQYVVEGSSSPEQRARFPLSAASVQVEPVDGAGHYNCVMHLETHTQYDQVVAGVTLKTRLERRR